MNPPHCTSNFEIKAYVSTRIKKDVTVVFDRLAGQPFIVLRGPNGAGKSTFLKAFIGLDQDSKARLEKTAVDGHITPYYPQEDRAVIRYMPQDPNEALFPRLSVADNIRLLSQILRIPENFIDSFPDIISDKKRSLGNSGLSGGEKKTLLFEAILRSLPNPDESTPVFVLLDEPFAGLDPSKTQLFLQKINEMATEYAKSNNVTFLIVDHDHISIQGATSRELYQGMKISHLERIVLSTNHDG